MYDKLLIKQGGQGINSFRRFRLIGWRVGCFDDSLGVVHRQLIFGGLYLKFDSMEEEEVGAGHFSDEDSFYAHSAEQQPEQEQAPEAVKHKEAKPKKKLIGKKREKTSKPAKKQHTTKQKEKEHKLSLLGDRKAQEILQKMRLCYEQDKELFQKKKLACQKLSYLSELTKELKNYYICEKFLERDGLAEFERWLDGIQIGEKTFEPSVSLRKGILEVLLSLTVNPETVSRTNEIQRLVARQKRSQIKELRDLSEKIILKWNKIAYEAE